MPVPDQANPRKVVKESSAALLVPNEALVPLQGDHRTICQFSDSPEDKQRINLVMPHVIRLVNEALLTDVIFITRKSSKHSYLFHKY